MRKIKSLVLVALVVSLIANTCVLAASQTEVTTAGGTATANIPLTVEDTSGGTEEPVTVFSAYVPSELPIKIDLEGNIVTPSNAMIINGVETKGIAVTALDIEVADGWSAADWSDDFESMEDDTKAISLKFRGDSLNADGSFNITEDNWKIPKDSYIPLEMKAKLPKQTDTGDKGSIATVQFTLDWSGDDTTTGEAIPSDDNYTLTIVAGEHGTVNDMSSIKTTAHGVITSLPDVTPDTGYALLKWVDADTGFKVSVGDTVDSDISIKPIFTYVGVTNGAKEKISVTFSVTNGTITDGEATLEVDEGTTFSEIAKPTASAEDGYELSGYYVDNVPIDDDYVISVNTTIEIRYEAV